MKTILSFFACFTIIVQFVSADGPVSDSSSVRYGLFAEYDGYFADLLGVRLKIDQRNTIIGQFSLNSSLFNDDGMEGGSVTEQHRNNSSALIGFEHCFYSLDRIDCQLYGAAEYSWSRTKQTENIYTYDAVTRTSTVIGTASTENKNDYYYLYAGIGLEYHFTDQLSMELMKRFEYSRADHYSTYVNSPPGSSSTVAYGFEDVFMNVIYYF